jgi:hypothetical protein
MSPTQVAAFTSDQVAAMSGDQISALFSVTPIVLDLSGTGIHTTSASAQGVNFDLTGTGHAQTVGWTGAGTGLLAIDLNGNGKIDNGSELFGVGTVLPNGAHAANGYQAMAAYDTNHDGRLDASDAVWSKLRVWVDANHDGVSQPGELLTMAQAGVASIDLHARAADTMQNGNLVGLVSSYTTTGGATHEVADVWFGKDASSTATPATTATTTTAATTPSLSELLAAPASTELPGAAADASAAHATATTTPTHAAPAAHELLMDHRMLGGDDPHGHRSLLI